MGNKQSSTTSPVPTSTSDVTEDRLVAAFRQESQNGKLSRVEFHNLLGFLEGMGLRRLQNTPLGAKLFFGIDKDGSGSIDQNEFVALGKCLIRGSMSDKVETTFNAYRGSQPEVSREAILSVLEESWNVAFSELVQRVAKLGALPGTVPSAHDITTFSQSNLPEFRRKAAQVIDACNVRGTGSLNKTEFAHWSQQDQTICARFGDISVKVAVSLVNIDKAL